ncbi:MAG: hypothetical protein WKF37_09585 [Bryobacteraceae bacterium]
MRIQETNRASELDAVEEATLALPWQQAALQGLLIGPVPPAAWSAAVPAQTSPIPQIEQIEEYPLNGGFPLSGTGTASALRGGFAGIGTAGTGAAGIGRGAIAAAIVAAGPEQPESETLPVSPLTPFNAAMGSPGRESIAVEIVTPSSPSEVAGLD